jgi:hypothetical protein
MRDRKKNLVTQQGMPQLLQLLSQEYLSNNVGNNSATHHGQLHKAKQI